MQILCIHVDGTPSWVGFHRRLGSTPIPSDPRLSKRSLTGITTYTVGETKTDVYMVDTTGAADATRLVKATFADADKTVRNAVPMDSRGGLILVRATTTTTQNNTQQQLLVYNPATRRRLALPPEPAFPYAGWSPNGSTCGVQYVLLVGGSDGEGASADADASVGRPFHVLMAKLVLSCYSSYRRLLVHSFSSEHGAWSPLTEIPTPNLLGSSGSVSSRPLVVGDDVVHWLCLTDSGSYMLVLHMGAAARVVNVTSLPASFPRVGWNMRRYLLATATAGGSPVVLVVDADKISAWEQSKHTRTWKPRPRVVMKKETILGFKDDGLAELVGKGRWWSPELLWFGERSGAVLLGTHGRCLLWLDLQSKKIVRCFCLDRRMSYQISCPYEVDLSSWVPTFSNAVTLDSFADDVCMLFNSIQMS